jgi:hypothetical protein
VLTPAKRIRLARAHRETYQAEAEVVGLVEELDAKNKTGILRTVAKEAISFVFDDPFFSDLKDALGSKIVFTRVKGIGVFDVNDRLSSVIEIDQLDSLPHYELVSEIESLSSLSNGWLEGNGVAPNGDNLIWLTNEVAKSFPEALDHPSVVPTEEGHVIFEWIRPRARIELEINFDDQKLELYATDLTVAKFEEASFGIDQWDEAFSKVNALLLT